MNTKEIKEYENVNGNILNGIIADDKIYYSVSNEYNNYDMMYINLADLDSVPELFKKNIEKEELLYYNGNLYYYENNYFISDTTEIKLPYSMHTVLINDKLMQVSISNNQDQILTITDLKNNEKKKFYKFFGMRREGDKLIICTYEDVYEYDLIS